MSNRVTIYDKNTGEHGRTGSYSDPKSQDLIAQGHIAIAGSHGSKTRWDFATSSVIQDAAKEQAAIDLQARKDELRARRATNEAALMASVGTIRTMPDINAAIDMLIEMLERP